MTTLEEHIIVVAAENRSLMLEKSMYDSWASRIRLFIKGKKHSRMMLDLIDNGPLVYPTVEENGQTRPKKYSELTEAQQLQDDCDVQAMNIILHGLPPDVTLVGTEVVGCSIRHLEKVRNSFGNKAIPKAQPKACMFTIFSGIRTEMNAKGRNIIAIESQEVHLKPFTSNNNVDLHELLKENEELLKFNNDFAKTFEKLLKEKRSLESEQSKLLNKINDLIFEVKKLTNSKEKLRKVICEDMLKGAYFVAKTKTFEDTRYSSEKSYSIHHIHERRYDISAPGLHKKMRILTSQYGISKFLHTPYPTG
ncbi:hypothetical protein Tco_1217355 [Tanacetum coccineum]